MRKIFITFFIPFSFLLLCCTSGFKLNQNRFIRSKGWESFRGNHENTAYIPQPIGTPNKLLWSFETKRPLKSSPIIANGILFIGSLDKKIFLVDAVSGENLGDHKISTSMSSSPCIKDTMAYFSCDKGDVTFFALNLLTGDFIWKKKLGDVSSSPQIYQDKIFIGLNSGLLLALNRESGEEIWEFETEDAVFSTPACDGEAVYFGSGDDNLYALDQKKGELKWKFQAEGSIYSSPAIKDDKVFFGSVDGHLYALKIEDGSVIWKFRTDGDIYSSPAVSESLVYIGSNDYFMNAVDLATGKLRWRFETGGIIRSSPVAVGDKLFFGSYDGSFYVLDRFTGKLLWNYETKGMISSSPAYYEGRIYIASEDGILYCFSF